MSSHRIKINPNDPSSFPEGRVDYARLDATPEEDLRNQEAQDVDVGNVHIGSTLDALLEADGVLEIVTSNAMSRLASLKSKKSQS